MSERDVGARTCSCRPVQLVTFACGHTCCNSCGKNQHFNYASLSLPPGLVDHSWNKDKCPDCSMAYNVAMLTKTLSQASLDHEQLPQVLPNPLQLQSMGSAASSPSLESPDFCSPVPQQYQNCSAWSKDPVPEDRAVKRQSKPAQQQQQQDVFQQHLPHYHHQSQQPQSGPSNNGLPQSHSQTPSSSAMPCLPRQSPPQLFDKLPKAELAETRTGLLDKPLKAEFAEARVGFFDKPLKVELANASSAFHGLPDMPGLCSGSDENASRVAKPPVGRALRSQQQLLDNGQDGPQVPVGHQDSQISSGLHSHNLPQVPVPKSQRHISDNSFRLAGPFQDSRQSPSLLPQGFHANRELTNGRACVMSTSSSAFSQYGGAKPKVVNSTVRPETNMSNGHAVMNGRCGDASSHGHVETDRNTRLSNQSPVVDISNGNGHIRAIAAHSSNSSDPLRFQGNNFVRRENGFVPFNSGHRNGTVSSLPANGALFGPMPSIPPMSPTGHGMAVSPCQLEMQLMAQTPPPHVQVCPLHCRPATFYCRLCDVALCLSCCAQGAEHEFHDVLYIEQEVRKQQQHMQQILPTYEDLVCRLAELQAAISAMEKAGETDLFRIQTHLQACLKGQERQKENLFACLSRILSLLRQLPLDRMRELVEFRASDTLTAAGGLIRRMHLRREFRWPVDQYDDTTLLPKDAQLMKGWGSAVSTSRQRLYVTDRDSHTVWVFRFVTKENGVQFPEPDFCFGKFGRKKGQFIRPTGVDVHDGLGRVAVVDKDNHRVQVFTLDGQFLFQFGRPRAEMERGRGDVLDYPWDVAFRQDGYLAVTNSKLNRINIFTADGSFYRMYPPENWYPHLFENPRGICFDLEGKLFVTDFQKSQLIVISRDLRTHKIYTCHVEEDVPNRVATASFNFPQGVAVDSTGSILVCDGKNLRVLRFSRDAFFGNTSNFTCLAPDVVYQTPGFNPEERLFSMCLSPAGYIITVHSVKRKEWLTQEMAARINRRIQKSRELSTQQKPGSIAAASVREGLHDVEKTRMLIFKP